MSDNSTTPHGTNHRREFLQRMVAAGAATGLGGMAGCAGSGGDETSTSGQSATTEISTGGQVNAGTQADVVKFDPHTTTAYSSTQVLENIYQKLTRITPELEPVGQLAQSWEVSDDGTTWTFSLAEGVMFHPPVSREMTADDVVYSINRILDDDTGSPRKSNFTPITNLEAADDYTVVFEFDEPYAPFLYKLTTSYVMPEGADEADEYDISSEPVGTGPFQFVEHVNQSHTLIESFDDYWETDENGTQLPYLDSVRFEPIPEGSSRVTNLKTGELEWIDSAPRSQASGLESSDGVTFSTKPGTWYDYIGFNWEQREVTDQPLRQAISHVVDREAIVQGARFGYANPTHDPVPPASVWKDLINNENKYDRNLERARELIEESAYDGETLEIMVGQQYKGQVSEAEIIQEQLSEVGIDVEVAPTEWGTMVSRLNDGDYQMTVVGWIGFLDPDSIFYQIFHTGTTFNWSGYSNDEVDQLLEQGRGVVSSREDRAEPYDRAMDLIAEDAPYTFLHFNDEIMAWKPSLNGFKHYATGTVRFKRTWLDDTS